MFKDILITAKRQKTEIIWIIASFCFAFLLNLFAIISKQTEWKELYTQALWLFIITCVTYALSVGIRIGIWFVLYLYKRCFVRK